MPFHTQEPLKVMHTNVSYENCTHVTGFRRFCLHLSSMFLHVLLLTDSCTESSWETAFPPHCMLGTLPCLVIFLQSTQ